MDSKPQKEQERRGRPWRGVGLAILPLPLAVVSLLTLLNLGLEGLVRIVAAADKLPWPARDVLPVYLLELPFLAGAAFLSAKQPGTFVGFGAGLAVLAVLNAAFYFFIGGIHP